MRLSRLGLLGAIGLALAAFFFFDLDRYLSLSLLQAQRESLATYRSVHPVTAALAYASLYVAVTALSLPGATVLTLAGAAIFGFGLTLALVSFASTIGATLAFLAARFLFRDWVRERFEDRVAAVDTGIRREGSFYLFAIRLTPIVPFWLVNLVMGLTEMRASTFYWVSQLGMLPGTAMFVYAGTQLGALRVSWGALMALMALGLFPLAARRWLDALRAKRVYRRWSRQRPERFDYNVVVIGGGPAGLVSSFIGAAAKARVAVIEQGRMGGDCLNTGCVPSKALLHTAKLLSHVARARELGITDATAQVDFRSVMERVTHVISTIAPHDSAERYRGLGVDVVSGRARIASPWTVQVTGETGSRTVTTRAIVIATGSQPLVPAIPGLEAGGYLTSNTVWGLRERPNRLVVLGGGSVGCELGQAFARIGSTVTIVEAADRLLTREDPDVSSTIQSMLERDGVRVLVAHTAIRVERSGGKQCLLASHGDAEVRLPFDALLVATGRAPNTSGLGLEDLGINLTGARTIETNSFLQTIYPNILACGDVAGPLPFTHTASHQAWHAAVNALFGGFRRFAPDYRVIPLVTFTDPEVAQVGLNESTARAAGVPYELTRYAFDDHDRAVIDGARAGFIKILTKPGSDRILGVTIVSEHAGDLLAEFTLAMQHGLGLDRILHTVHPYPTMVEANRSAAGVWRRTRITHGQEAFLQAFQNWRRGSGSFATLASRLPSLLRHENPRDPHRDPHDR